MTPERMVVAPVIDDNARTDSGRHCAGVVHCREPHDVYIGRPARGHRGSKWANPFREGGDGDRREVIAKYEDWLRSQPALMAALPELRGKVLGCWCAPKPCHGEVLVRLANGGTASRAGRRGSGDGQAPH